MFDLTLLVDFENRRPDGARMSFLADRSYCEIRGVERCRRADHAFMCYLERTESDENYYEDNKIHCMIYGTVFTNNEYTALAGVRPYKMTARGLRQFYREYGEDFVRYLKGSFVLVIFREATKEVIVVTDRLNVLPLYYWAGRNYLVLSSSVRMILNMTGGAERLNHQALAEQLIFDYVIGTKTFFRDIQQTAPGTIHFLSREGVRFQEYWTVESLYHGKLLPRKDSLELLCAQLHDNVNLYAADADSLLVSLTGGFDGRANLAMLERDAKDFLCYSYGMPGSKQIEIPKIIAEKLHLNFRAVYLDDDYLRQYEQCALRAIEFSHGTAPIMRANYPYSFQILRDYSTTSLTGLFGSEILRPLYNLGIMMNEHSERAFLGNDVRGALRESARALKRKSYIRDDILDECGESIAEDLEKNFVLKYKEYDPVTRLFFFLLREGIRKFFMQEIQIQRVYVTNRFPYFDDDFVDLMYRTPFAGIYNGFLGKSKVKRRKGQLLYAHIIEKYRPELGDIALDRGYTPGDLLKPFPVNYFYLWRGVRRTKAYYSKRGNDTFNSEVWTDAIFSRHATGKEDVYGIFGKGLAEAYASKNHLRDLLKYSHMISLKLYLESMV